MAQQIEITFNDLGSPTIHVTGVKGAACHDVTKALEKALGVIATSETTVEYFQRASQQQQRAGQ